MLEVQDELIERIVATLVGRLEETGAETAMRKRAENLGAFDLLMRGMHYADRLDPESAERAIECFEKALAITPDYPSAMAMLALMRLRDWALHPGKSDLAEAALSGQSRSDARPSGQLVPPRGGADRHVPKASRRGRGAS